MRFVVAFFLTLTVPACVTDDDPGEGSRLQPHQIPPETSEPNFVLYVSNQSFDIDPVDIEVSVDGDLVVEGDFLVEGQHSWHVFELELAPGERTLRAVSRTGDTELVETVDIAGQTRYGVFNFWYYPADSTSEAYGPGFTFTLSDDPPGFD